MTETKLAAVIPWDSGPPQFNGPSLLGIGTGNAFYRPVPITGERPLSIEAEGLPDGLYIDPDAYALTGRCAQEGEYNVTLRASNVHGNDEKMITVRVGDRICLTPPLGWNSWNVWGADIDARRIRSIAELMVSTGLAAHGYSYLNIDDGWQGMRGGPLNAIQPNERFGDMAALCAYVHSLGLCLGIYSTPWSKSYAGLTGGSSGDFLKYTGWDPENEGRRLGRFFGETCHCEADAKQWADWGIDYLKYDWAPWEVDDVAAMADALGHAGRDIVYSLSNSAPFELAPEWMRLAHCWRTTGDITDTWESVSGIGFSQEKWAPYAGPGHWNDPDMLVVGSVGWGEVRENRLTKDEQVSHVTLWALLSAPLLIGCDLERMDDFTLRLLCNQEVIAVNQDALGEQARCVSRCPGSADEGINDNHSVYIKSLVDGRYAIGVFNHTEETAFVTVDVELLGLKNRGILRDLWSRGDISKASDPVTVDVAAHGARLLCLQPG